MSAATAEKRRCTVEEYLELERNSLDKHEFFDGEIFLMAGARPEHNLIMANLQGALTSTLGSKWRVYSSEQRLHIPATGLYTYADASLVCGANPEFNDEAPPSLLNPEAIFEVLSESTESYDRGQKFEHYRSIKTLQHYVLVSQSKVLVEHFTRQESGWLLQETRAGQVLRLPCGEIAINPLYRWVLPT